MDFLLSARRSKQKDKKTINCKGRKDKGKTYIFPFVFFLSTPEPVGSRLCELCDYRCVGVIIMSKNLRV